MRAAIGGRTRCGIRTPSALHDQSSVHVYLHCFTAVRDIVECSTFSAQQKACCNVWKLRRCCARPSGATLAGARSLVAQLHGAPRHLHCNHRNQHSYRTIAPRKVSIQTSEHILQVQQKHTHTLTACRGALGGVARGTASSRDNPIRNERN